MIPAEVVTIGQGVVSGLISRSPSLVLACDVDDLDRLAVLCEAVEGTPSVSAIKIGLSLVCRFGMEAVIARIRQRTSAKIIYDHQKGGTDIPELAVEFAKMADPADAVILFPMSGPHSQDSFTQTLHDRGKTVLIGAAMTHPAFLVSQGGYIADEAVDRILNRAIESGVRNFVFPGTNPELIKSMRITVEKRIASGDYDIFAPGLIAQGGRIEELRAAAGPRWHAIVGRAVTSSSRPDKTLSELAAML